MIDFRLQTWFRKTVRSLRFLGALVLNLGVREDEVLETRAFLRSLAAERSEVCGSHKRQSSKFQGNVGNVPGKPCIGALASGFAARSPCNEVALVARPVDVYTPNHPN